MTASDSNAGLHIHARGPALDQALSGSKVPRLIVALDDPGILDRCAQAGVPIRIYRDSGTDGRDASGAAALLLTHDLRNATHIELACETTDQADNPAWNMAVANLLRGGGYQGRILGGAWATGNPSQYDSKDHPKPDGTWTHADGTPHFPALVDWAAVLRPGGPMNGVADHGYVGYGPDVPGWPNRVAWYSCRYRMQDHCLQLHGADPNLEWATTEAGYDREEGRTLPGWEGITPGQYLGLIAANDAESRKDPRHLGHAYFTVGAPTGVSPDWTPWNLGPLMPALLQYLAGAPASLATTAVPDVPAPPGPTGVELEAWNYYTQRGFKVDRTHAIWTVGLLPMYTTAKRLRAQGDPAVDGFNPGPLNGPERSQRWGSGATTRPAASVSLTNGAVAVYQDEAGNWHLYRPEQ